MRLGAVDFRRGHDVDLPPPLLFGREGFGATGFNVDGGVLDGKGEAAGRKSHGEVRARGDPGALRNSPLTHISKA